MGQGVCTPLLSCCQLNVNIDHMLEQVYGQIGRRALIQGSPQVHLPYIDVISGYSVCYIPINEAAHFLVPLTHFSPRSGLMVHGPGTCGQCCKRTSGIFLLRQIYLVGPTRKWHIGNSAWVKGVWTLFLSN